MNSRQLSEIKKFSEPFYSKTGRYHGWDHVLRVRENALLLAKDYHGMNKYILEAACYLHDIGRSLRDEGHARESYRLSKKFLEKIEISRGELMIIKDAVSSHDISNILKSKTLEARLLFDADKIEILSVQGFFRTSFFLVDERRMKPDAAVSFLWRYTNNVYKKYLFTKKAKALLKVDLKLINFIYEKYKN